MAQGDTLQKLQDLLKELFQLKDSVDLDFGIYRVLHLKRKQVGEFIGERLPKIVAEAFAHYAAADRVTTERELEQKRKEIIETAAKLAATAFDETGQLVSTFRNTPLGKQFQELEERARAGRAAEELQASVYNDLYIFFSRYYEDGDIFSKPRRGKVEIPFTGHEDVVLHWANRDQYYIKTGEQFKSYRFTADVFAVEFALRNASTEQNNNKGERRYFVLAKESSIAFDATTRTLKIFLEYRFLSDTEKITYGKSEQQKPQDKLNFYAAEATLKKVEHATLRAHLARPLGEDKPSLLLYHLARFTRKNTNDFFIHKDLRGFLIRELEDFLKREVVRTDELLAAEHVDVPQRGLLRAQVVRRMAVHLIDFLAQVEDFQRKLFEKRKFVVRTEYCITLDRLSEVLWEEVLKNEAQLQEWRDNYALDDLLKLSKKKHPDAEFLREHDKLVVDTRHFSEEFKWQLLGAFDDLDAALDGLLMKSENFQALMLLVSKYHHDVKCIYIDPPYNTGSDEFLYKDNYQHSCWLTMMADRNALAAVSMSPDGVMLISIDDHEVHSLRRLLNDVLGEERFVSDFVWNTEGHTDNQFQVKVNHEYIMCFGSPAGRASLGYVIDPNTREESNLWKGFAENSITKNGRRNPPREVTLPNGFPCKVDATDIPATKVPKAFYADVAAQGYISRAITKRHGLTYPIRKDRMLVKNGVLSKPCRVFTGWANVEKLLEFIDSGFNPVKDSDGEVTFHLSENGVVYYRKKRESARNILSVLQKMGTTEQMKYELESMGLVYDYPKPKQLIKHLLRIGGIEKEGLALDYFAGSGTTGHAVIDLNRADGHKRKYILVELSDCFDSVILPRIKKVAFCENWKDHKPKGGKGVSHFLKYQALEQYEDTLNNLELPRAREGELALHAFGDEYILCYMLEFEAAGSASLLSLDRLRHPFAYKLKVYERDEPIERTVDLVETFNYLLGLDVGKLREMRDGERLYRMVLGRSRNGKGVIVVWRDMEGLEDNKEALQKDRQFIEGKVLPSLLGKEKKPDRLLVNGQCVAEGAEAIEPEFHRLMFAPVG